MQQGPDQHSRLVGTKSLIHASYKDCIAVMFCASNDQIERQGKDYGITNQQ